MGVDLTIAIETRVESTWFLAFNRLMLDRDAALFNRIKAVPSFPLPEACTFDWYGDDGLRREKEDAYGDPLRYLRSSSLAYFVSISEETSDWNKAVFALLREMHPDRRVVLWWS